MKIRLFVLSCLALALGANLATQAAAAMLTANFDDLAANATTATLTDGGIEFNNAASTFNPGVFGVSSFATSPASVTSQPGISVPNLLSIGGAFANEHYAFTSFDFAAASGALATSAGLTALDSGLTAGNTLTLEGFLLGTEINSVSVTLTSTKNLAYSLTLPTGVYDSFSIVAAGSVNEGNALTDFDDVTINTVSGAPEPSTWALLGLSGTALLTVTLRRQRRVLALAAICCSIATLGAAHARAQAMLTFSGGNGAPLVITLAQPITLTITKAFNSSTAYLDIQGLNAPNPAGYLGGNVTLTLDTGTANPLYTLQTITFTTGDITAGDGLFQANTSAFSVGQTVTVSAGTLTSTSNYSAAPPNSGSYSAFLFNNNTSARISTNGVLAPEPSSWVLLGLGASLLGLALRRRATRV